MKSSACHSSRIGWVRAARQAATAGAKLDVRKAKTGLTPPAPIDMVFHMAKTTLNIPDPLFRELKRRAVSKGETMSNLVAEYIRRGLEQKPERKSMPPLPSYDGGPFLVDVSDRDALFEVLDGDRYKTGCKPEDQG